MAELKTQPTDQSVESFLDGIEDEKKRKDSYTILELMKQVTQLEPVMWGDSIIGFGKYHYKYASGREGDSPLTGFSPRKREITIYITSGFDQYQGLLAELGKHRTGKVCLYIKKIEDIDLSVLRELIRQSAEHMVESNK